MNRRGQLNIIAGVVILLTGIIGLIVVDSVAVPTYTTINYANTTINPGRMYNNESYVFGNAAQCKDGSAVTLVYDLTNSSVVAGSDYSFPQGTDTFTLATNASGAAHNNTLGTINYTSYDCDAYIQNPTARVVISNLALIASIGLLALGGMWLYLKGGF